MVKLESEEFKTLLQTHGLDPTMNLNKTVKSEQLTDDITTQLINELYKEDFEFFEYAALD